MSSRANVSSGLHALEHLACQLSLVGVGARGQGWQVVGGGWHLIGRYPSQHPVGVPV